MWLLALTVDSSTGLYPLGRVEFLLQVISSVLVFAVTLDLSARLSPGFPSGQMEFLLLLWMRIACFRSVLTARIYTISCHHCPDFLRYFNKLKLYIFHLNINISQFLDKLAMLIRNRDFILEVSAQDPDPLGPQDFDFLDSDPQKYADPRIRIQGAKYQSKTAKKNFTLKTQVLSS